MDDQGVDAKSRITRYYADLIQKYGHDSRACDYGQPESQKRKFHILSEVLPLKDEQILDVGCGFADYADFLLSRFPGITYEGVDITPQMISEASRRHPTISLRVMDVLEENPGRIYDVVTANGIFYLRNDNPQYVMQRIISCMYELCSKAVAFNSLSAWSSAPNPNEFYADPVSIINFCRTLTPWVVMRHDYSASDFTIYLYREACKR